MAAVCVGVLVLATAACSSSTPSPGAAGPTTAATSATVPSDAPASEQPTTAPVTPPAQPRVPSDPTELARQLVADEMAIRAPGTTPSDLEAAARRAQLAYRMLGHHPEWDSTVAPLVPAELQLAVSKNIDARRRFVHMALDTETRDTLPAWRIVAPAPAEELLAYYHEAEQASGVGWSYLAAINLVETGLGRIRGTSTAGAQGPMQFLPSTWAAYGAGGDIDSPHDAILGAARYLAANGFADGDVSGSLRRYNNSDDYVAAVQDYAEALAAEPDTFAAYRAWEVYYFTTAGDVLLPVGYEQPERMPVTDYLATHPQ
ncbi:MAG: lytic murein transglycosylase [Acidimicrobiales bacterium]